jgi:hypothetical protein
MLLFIMRRDAASDHLVQTMKEYIANDRRLVGKGNGPPRDWAQAGAYFL